MKNIKCVIRKNLKTKDNEHLIYIRYTYNRRFFLFRTDVYVMYSNWNIPAGRVRKSDNYELKNKILEDKERDFEKIVLEVMSQKKEPNLLNVKAEFYKAKNVYQSDEAKPKKQDEKKFLKDFQAFIDEKENNDEVGLETIKTYKTTKAKLTQFQEKTNYFLHYDTINNDFYFQFLKYMREKGLVDNSADKHIKNLKLFMKYALSNEKHNNNIFHTFKRTKAKAEFVVLDEMELQKLLYDYEPETTYHKQVRDTFVLGCSTGLRFGDLTNLTIGNFHISRDKTTNKIIETARDSYIAVPTQKTNEYVRIPVNPFICELIDEYNIENKEPVFLRHNPQVFNRTIKKICEKAGINRIEKVNKLKNSEYIPAEGPKWQFVSSHTMRRTFITLLASMTQISNIQAVSGHKDIKVLMDYIKRNDKELNQVRGCFNDVFSRSIKDYFDEKKPTQTAKVRATPIRTDVITH